MSELKVGDVVRLKSGGPLMTINNIAKPQYDDNMAAWCVWFDSNKEVTGTFPLTSLKIYESA